MFKRKPQENAGVGDITLAGGDQSHNPKPSRRRFLSYGTRGMAGVTAITAMGSAIYERQLSARKHIQATEDLLNAIEGRDLGAVKKAIDNGAYVNGIEVSAPDGGNNHTLTLGALMECARETSKGMEKTGKRPSNLVKIVQLLLENGANPNAVEDGVGGNTQHTVAHILLSKVTDSHLLDIDEAKDFLAVMRQHHADINMLDGEGRTPLTAMLDNALYVHDKHYHTMDKKAQEAQLQAYDHTLSIAGFAIREGADTSPEDKQKMGALQNIIIAERQKLSEKSDAANAGEVTGASISGGQTISPNSPTK